MTSHYVKTQFPRSHRRGVLFLHWHRLLSILVFPAITVVARAGDSLPAGERIQSWAELEKELAKTVSLEKPPDYGLSGSPRFNSILAHGDESLWREMLNQQEHPLVVLAGYVCIESKAHEKAFECALRSIAYKPPDCSIAFYAPMLQRLQKAEPTQANFKTLSSVLGPLKIDRKSGAVWVLAGGLTYTFLYKWMDDSASDDAPWSLRAYVLDRLYGDAAQQKATITDRMKGTLEAASSVPGWPRLVFLTHTQRLDESFSKSVLETVADPSIEDLSVYSILENHLPYVRERQHELTKVKMGDSRRKLVDKAIEDASRRK